MAKKKTTKKKRKNYNKNSSAKKIIQQRKSDKKKFNTVIIFLGLIIVMLSIITVMIKLKLDKTEQQLVNCKGEVVTLEMISPHYLFLGDSITEQYELHSYFEGYSVVNSGIGGDTTDDILNNMYERVYRYNPSTIFLMIGTNDVNHNKSAEYIFNNIKKIVNEIQKNVPNARVIVESITPSRGDWGETDNNEKRQEINRLLKDEYKNSEVVYIDLYSLLQEEDSNKIKNEYTKDGLHLNNISYELIAKEQKKYMK